MDVKEFFSLGVLYLFILMYGFLLYKTCLILDLHSFIKFCNKLHSLISITPNCKAPRPLLEDLKYLNLIKETLIRHPVGGISFFRNALLQ